MSRPCTKPEKDRHRRWPLGVLQPALSQNQWENERLLRPGWPTTNLTVGLLSSKRCYRWIPVNVSSLNNPHMQMPPYANILSPGAWLRAYKDFPFLILSLPWAFPAALHTHPILTQPEYHLKDVPFVPLPGCFEEQCRSLCLVLHATRTFVIRSESSLV